MSSLQDIQLAAQLERLSFAPRDCAGADARTEARRELCRLLGEFDPETFDGGFDIPAFVAGLTDAEVADTVEMLTAEATAAGGGLADDELSYDEHDLSVADHKYEDRCDTAQKMVR